MGTLPVGSTQNKPVSLTNGKAAPSNAPQKTPQNDLHYSPPPYDVTLQVKIEPFALNDAVLLTNTSQDGKKISKEEGSKRIDEQRNVKQEDKVDEKGGVMVLVSDIVDYASSLYDGLGKLASELFNEIAGLVTTKERVVKDISTSETRLDKLEKSGQGKSAEAIQLKAKIEKLKSLNSQLDDLIVSANRIRETLKSGKLNKEEYINSLLNKAGIEKRTKEIQDEFAEIEGSLPLDRENAPQIIEVHQLIVGGEDKVAEFVTVSRESNRIVIEDLKSSKFDRADKNRVANLVGESQIVLQETNSSAGATLVMAKKSLEDLRPMVSGAEKEKVDSTISEIEKLRPAQAATQIILKEEAREYLAVVTTLQLEVNPDILGSVNAIANGEDTSKELTAFNASEGFGNQAVYEKNSDIFYQISAKLDQMRDEQTARRNNNQKEIKTIEEKAEKRRKIEKREEEAEKTKKAGREKVILSFKVNKSLNNGEPVNVQDSEDLRKERNKEFLDLSGETTRNG